MRFPRHRKSPQDYGLTPLGPLAVHRPSGIPQQLRHPALSVAAILAGKLDDGGRQSRFVIRGGSVAGAGPVSRTRAKGIETASFALRSLRQVYRSPRLTPCRHATAAPFAPA
jgi:hypothetical protein